MHARRYRRQLAKGLSNPGPRAGVRLLLPDLSLGRVADVRSSRTGPWRFIKLYGGADHFMGAFRKIFAPQSVPQRFKNQFPASLVLRPTQLRAAAEESALLIPVAAQFQASYPNIDCQVRILHGAEDQVIEPKQAQDLYQALPRSDLRWAYGHPFRTQQLLPQQSVWS